MLRALAAWMVVYYHFMQMYFKLESDSFLGLFFSKYGNFGVDIFFVLSGFVMYLSVNGGSQNAYQFMVNRIIRIIPVYWFYTAVIAACVLFFPIEFSYTDYDVQSLVYSLAFIPGPNPTGLGQYPLLAVGWTLNYEMFFYATLCACLLISKRLAIGLCFCIIVILPIIWPKTAAFAYVASSPLLYEFIVGFLIAFAATNKTLSPLLLRYKKTCLTVLLLTVAMAAYRLHAHLIFRLMTAGGIVFLFLWAEPYINARHPIVKNLVKLGDESYSTYLAHLIVIGVFLHITGSQISSMEALATVLLLSLTLVLVSRLSYAYIEANSALYALRKRLLETGDSTDTRKIAWGFKR